MKTKQSLLLTCFTITNLLLLSLFSLSGVGAKAQNIGINGTGANAHASALLDIDDAGTNTKGILIPRIPLTAINAAAPVTSPATSLLVYNTAIASTGTNAVSPGYYYWDGVKWVRFAYSASGSSANDWNILGNSGTVDGTNFIGTTDNIPFSIRVNNQKAGRIDHILSNTAFGYQSLNSNLTGSDNTSMGVQSLFLNTTGGRNTAIGFQALNANTTASKNTAVGHNSMFSNTIGNSNTALGFSSLFSNTTATANVAIGVAAMYSNTVGSDNTAIGEEALTNNSSGNKNTALGAFSAFNNSTGNENTTIGYQTMRTNTTGSLNVAIGSQAGFNNTTGNLNTFIGAQAGFGTTTSGGNTAVGYLSLNGSNLGSLNSALGFRSLQNNTTGTENLGTGYAALFQNTTGLNNTATGAGTMRDNTTGSNNTAVGRAALSLNITGSNNTVIGQRAGATNSIITTHNNNTFIGAETNATINNLTNATAIGYNAKVGQSNALILGGTGPDAVNVGIGTTTPNEMFTLENGNMQLGESMPATGLGRQVFFSDVANNAFDPIYFQRQNISSDFSNLNLSIGDNYNVGYSNDKFNVGAGYSSGIFNSVLTVEMGNARVGINTTNPTEKLEVQGSVKIVDGTQGAGRVLVSDAAGKASWKEAAINTNKLSYSATYPATVAVTAPGSLINLGAPFNIATTGIYRVLVDATIPQGMILGIDNQSLSNAILYATVSNRYYAQYFVYVTAGTHNLILYNDANPALTDGGPYWQFVIEGPIN